MHDIPAVPGEILFLQSTTFNLGINVGEVNIGFIEENGGRSIGQNVSAGQSYIIPQGQAYPATSCLWCSLPQPDNRSMLDLSLISHQSQSCSKESEWVARQP